MANVILGGGIGGLSTAYYLSRQTQRGIQLLEASERLGGWIRTSKSENGTIFEHGPRTIRPVGDLGKNTLKLIEDIGLADAVHAIPKGHPAAVNRMIYVNNKLHTLPNSLKALFKKTPPFSKPIAFSIFRDLLMPRKRLRDDSIYNFVERRLGKELADLAISPMVCGICAGDAKEISVKFLMKQLFEHEQKYGGIAVGTLRNLMKGPQKSKLKNQCELYDRAVKERWSVWSLAGGLQTLPQRLGHILQNSGVDVRLQTKCSQIEFAPGQVSITVGGSKSEGEHLYSALPSHELARLISDKHPVLKEELAAIPFVNVAVVNLAYNGKVLPEEGFGFLVPPNQNIPILGVIFDTCCFPQGDKTVLTVMMGGKWFEQQFGKNPSQDTLSTTAQQQVKSALGIKEEPVSTNVSILKKCIPQYIVGHSERVARIRQYLTDKKIPLTLVGSSYDGVGVNDVVMSARNAVISPQSLS